jgi:hypothetical protein
MPLPQELLETKVGRHAAMCGGMHVLQYWPYVGVNMNHMPVTATPLRMQTAYLSCRAFGMGMQGICIHCALNVASGIRVFTADP